MNNKKLLLVLLVALILLCCLLLTACMTKEEFNYYDKKRLAIVEKAKECDKVLDKVELELKKDKSLNNVSKASKPRR